MSEGVTAAAIAETIKSLDDLAFVPIQTNSQSTSPTPSPTPSQAVSQVQSQVESLTPSNLTLGQRHMQQKGIFIVFEGIDNSGKTTQCKLLVEAMNDKGYKTVWMAFPNRTTEIGRILDQYLKGDILMDPHVAKLLFLANISEMYQYIRNTLDSGVHIVCDRYIISHWVYSYATCDAMNIDKKQTITKRINKNNDLCWTQLDLHSPLTYAITTQHIANFIKPDLCFYIEITASESIDRSLKGSKKLEVLDVLGMQEKFIEGFKLFEKESCYMTTVLDGNSHIRTIHNMVTLMLNSCYNIDLFK